MISYFLVEILQIFEVLYVSKRKFLENLNQWNAYMSLKQFPKKFQRNMTYFYMAKYGDGRYFNEALIFDGISGKCNDVRFSPSDGICVFRIPTE